MIFNVHGGHNTIVPGASGHISEVTEDRAVKNLVAEKLRKLGHTVYDCTDDTGRTQGQNLSRIVNKCNEHSVDLDVSIHFNAGGGHGTEVLVYSDTGKAAAYAVSICAAIKELGLTNRGVKERKDLYVLRKTNSPALLIECCFVDSDTDCAIYTADSMANAIVKGITGQSVENGTEDSTASQTAAQSGKLTVDGIIGAATIRALQEKLGTTVDGRISGQLASSKKYFTAFTDGVCSWSGGKSQAVKALQKLVGVTADGLLGRNTAKKWQEFLGVTADGYFGEKSAKALQEWLNG